MADAFALANAFVRIRPTTTGFRADADSQIQAATAGIKPTVKIGADTAEAKASTADLKAYVNALTSKVYAMRLVADDKAAQASLASMYGQLLRINKTVAKPMLSISGLTTAQTALLGIDAALDKVSGRVVAAHVQIDDADAERRMAMLVAQITALNAEAANVRLSIDGAGAEIILGDLAARLAQIDQMARNMVLGGSTDQLQQAEAEISRLAADFGMLTAAEDVAAVKTRSFGGLFSTIMKILTTQVALFGGALPGMLGEVAVWHIITDLLIEFAAVLGPAIIAMGVWGAVAIPTLENIYKQMKNVYTVTQATGQSLYPVSGGFKALSDAVQPSVYQIFGDALTLMNSKSQTLAGSLKQTGSVIDGFGARIAVALQSGDSSKFFATANQDLQRLGDELGNIFGIVGNLVKTMPGYAEVLLNVFDSASKGLENLTSSAVTQKILGLTLAFHGAYLYTGLAATAFGKLASGGLAKVGDLAEKAGMALSSYGGLAQKASLGLGSMAARSAELAALPWTWIGVVAAGIAILAYRLITAKDATQQLFDAQQAYLQQQNAVKGAALLQADQAQASANLATAQRQLVTSGSALLVIQAAGATAGMNLSGSQKQVLSATSLLTQAQVKGAAAGNALTDAQSNAANIAANSAVANRDLASQQRQVLSSMTVMQSTQIKGVATGIGLADAANKQVSAYKNAAVATSDYAQQVKTLNDQSVLYNTRLSNLAVAFGSLGAAQGILLASGVTMKQMLTGGTQAWLEIAQQVSATEASYRAMGQTQGILGADMNALNIAASSQVTQMTNLNKAFDTVIGIVSGGQGTFITFEQSLAATVKAGAAAGSSMTGLSSNSLALRSAFQSSYSDAAKMLDALRLMTATTPDSQSGSFPVLTKSIQDTLAQLIPFGSQSSATQAELVALAQEVNPAITNFQQLVKWVGNTKDPAKDLDTQLSTLGVNMQNLSADASGLYSSLQNNIINQFNIAKLSSSGVSTAIKAVGTDIGNLSTKSGKTIGDIGTLATAFHAAGINANDASSLILSMVGHISLAGETSAQKHQSLVNLYNDFHNAGFSAQQADKLVFQLTGQLLQIPKNTPVNVVLHGSGSGKISVSESLPGSATTTQENLIFGNRGFKIPGYGGGDKHPAMLEAGETIVPKHLTPMVAPLMKKHGVPGFASGGIIGTSPATLGMEAMRVAPWAAQAEAQFGAGAMTAWGNALVSKAKVDVDKMQKDAVASNAAGPGGGAPAANAALARKLMPAWGSGVQWTDWNNVAMRESGWNQFARNASSGAYGIPQALPPSKMGAAANPPDSNPTAQIRWMIGYIQGRYGNPAGAWQHELDVGWYAKGTGGGPSGGARAGWGVVGERGRELVLFHGGEHVMSNPETRKVLAGQQSLPGYANGAPVKAPVETTAQKKAAALKAARLKELAADVGKENKLVAARTKHRKALALGIYSQELYDIQHPKDKKGPLKLKALEKANTAYLKSSGAPIIVLQKEVALLRALTGEPKGALYGDTSVPGTSTSGSATSGTSTSGTSASASSAAAAAATAAQNAANEARAAQEIAAFAQGILPSSGGVPGGQSGISVGSAPAPSTSFTAGSGTGVSTGSTGGAGTIGSMFPSPVGPRIPVGTPPSASPAQGFSMLASRLDQLISVTRAIPGQSTAGMQAVMGGVTTRARQGSRFNTRG